MAGGHASPREHVFQPAPDAKPLFPSAYPGASACAHMRSPTRKRALPCPGLKLEGAPPSADIPDGNMQIVDTFVILHADNRCRGNSVAGHGGELPSCEPHVVPTYVTALSLLLWLCHLSGSGWAPKIVSTGYLPAGRVTPSPSLSRAGSAGESKLLVRSRAGMPCGVLHDTTSHDSACNRKMGLLELLHNTS